MPRQGSVSTGAGTIRRVFKNANLQCCGKLLFDLLRCHRITTKMKKPLDGNQSPSEASLSNPWGGTLSWPSPEG